MPTLITSAGEAHLVALGVPGTVTTQFNAASLGRGSNELALNDTVGALLRPFLELAVVEGYPRRNDVDPRNSGRGGDRWTWAFVAEPGEAFVATNLMVHELGASGMGPAIVSSDDTLEKRSSERLTIFVNARSGGPATVITASEEVGLQPARHAWAPRARALAIAVSGLGVSSDRVLAKPGELVRVMALMPDDQGGVLTKANVGGVELHVWRRTRVGTFEHIDDRLLDRAENEGAFGAIVTDDPRWPLGGGYNVAGNFVIPLEERAIAYVIELRVRTKKGLHRSETWGVDVELLVTSGRR